MILKQDYSQVQEPKNGKKDLIENLWRQKYFWEVIAEEVEIFGEAL